MPITNRDGKWYWGKQGPFNSRKKAEEVAQAAHASGYTKALEKLVFGAPMDGQPRQPTAAEIIREEKRGKVIRKEDGGGDGGGGFGGTAFTSTDAGIFNPTFGEKKKKKKTGIERLHDFITDKSPLKLSKMTSSTGNGKLGPVRIDWDKRKLDDEDPPQVIEEGGDDMEEGTVAAQKDFQRRIEDLEEETKEKDLQLQSGFGTMGAQGDALHRANPKDQLSRNPLDEDEEEEDSTDPEVKRLSKALFDKMWPDGIYFSLPEKTVNDE